MSEMEDERQTPSRGHDQYGDPWPGERVVSLTQLVNRLSRYRGVLAVVTFGCGALFLVIGLAVLLWTPVLKRVSVEFDLEFPGIEDGRYPNGLPFSTQDIVAVPVLSQVYQANALQSLLSLQDFIDSVFVLAENESMKLLDDEYRSKLADLRLNSVDRLQLEDDYRARRKALKTSSYSLNFLREESLVRMPDPQISKVLLDILAAWAVFMDEKKGALKYDRITYSENLLRNGSLASADSVVAVDVLRSRVLLALVNVDAMSELPGAALIRVGPEGVSLAEIRLMLQDIQSLRVDPLLQRLRFPGSSKNRESVSNFLEGRLHDIELKVGEVDRKVRTLQDGLDRYSSGHGVLPAESTGPGVPDSAVPTMIPQFGESFLDRLLEMSGQDSDLAFRQEMTERIVDFGLNKVTLEQRRAYYQDLLRDFTGPRRSGAAAASAEQIEAEIDTIREELLQAVALLGTAYTELSERNLNPPTLLYRVSNAPVVSWQRYVSLKFLASSFVVSLALVLALTVLACLAYDVSRARA